MRRWNSEKVADLAVTFRDPETCDQLPNGGEGQVRQGLRLISPRDPFLWVFFNDKALALFTKGQYDEAIYWRAGSSQ
jgi:hypothetical protein